jgi:hypothetical protein
MRTLHILFNPLTDKLNPSAQRCLTRFFYWGFCFLNRAFRQYMREKPTNVTIIHAPRHYTQHAHPQYYIACSFEHLSEGTKNAP